MCAKKKAVHDKMWRMAGEPLRSQPLSAAEREIFSEEFSTYRQFRSGTEHGTNWVTPAAARLHQSAAEAAAAYLCEQYGRRYRREDVVKAVSAAAAIPVPLAERLARHPDFLLGAALWLLDYWKANCEDSYLSLLPTEFDELLSGYLSCSRMYNDYDGVQHDYTRKQGLAWQQVFLPEMAPTEWADREFLWNAVEEAEKTKDRRLALEFVVALPVELGKDEWICLLTGFIQTNFVAEGMCADVCIHDTDGHNPHAHIMLTVRPLAENGKWQQKTEKEYLCVRGGEKRVFTAAEFKSAQAEGWEKQYQYKVGRKKVYMTPSTAEAQGLERVSKYPKSTKYGLSGTLRE